MPFLRGGVLDTTHARGMTGAMTIEDDIAFLERVPALSILGRDALRIIAIGSESRYVHEGNALFGEGEDADCGLCGAGRLVRAHGGKNGRIAPTVAGRGALIGELALLTETKRPVSAVAREPSSVVRIPRQLSSRRSRAIRTPPLRMRDALAARVEPDDAANSSRCARCWRALRAQVNAVRGSSRRSGTWRRKSRRTSSARWSITRSTARA